MDDETEHDRAERDAESQDQLDRHERRGPELFRARLVEEALVPAIGSGEVVEETGARLGVLQGPEAGAAAVRLDRGLGDLVPSAFGGGLTTQRVELGRAVGRHLARVFEIGIEPAVGLVERGQRLGPAVQEVVVERVLAREHVGRERTGDDRLVVVLVGHPPL
jgi:hypothetical protein